MELIKPKITNLKQIQIISNSGLPLTALLYSRAFVDDCDVPLKSRQGQSKVVCFNSGVFTKITPMYITIPVGSPIYDKNYLQKIDLINQLKNCEALKANWSSIIVNTVAECKKEYPDLDYHIIEELGPTTFYFFSGSVEDFAEATGLHEQAGEFTYTFNKYFSKLTRYHRKFYVIDVIAPNYIIREIQDSVIKSHQYLDEKFYDFNKVCDSNIDPMSLSQRRKIEEVLIFLNDIKEHKPTIANHLQFHAERLLFLTNDKNKLNEKI